MIARPNLVRKLCAYGTKRFETSMDGIFNHRRSLSIPNHGSHRYQMTGSPSLKTMDFVVKDDDDRLIDQSLKEKTNVSLDDLKIDLGSETMVYNLTWLRDSCHCNQCTHPHSRQRLYTAKDFRREHFKVSQIDVVPANLEGASKDRMIQGYGKSDLLKIQWADGHKSLYSLSWLSNIQPLCDQTRLRDIDSMKWPTFSFPRDDFYSAETAITEVQWSVEDIRKSLTSVDYSDLLEGFKFHNETTFINANSLSDISSIRSRAISELTSNLATYGLAKLVNVPCKRDHVLKVAKSLAYERPTGYGVVFDVVVEPSEQINLAYSAKEFDLHTDLPYRETSPGVQLLHCISNTTHGGLSYFSDAFRAAKSLRDEHPRLFEILVRSPVSFTVRDPYRNMNFRRHQPIISLNHEGNLEAIHYSPFTLPPIGHRDDIKLFYVAQDLFTSYLQAKENKLVTKMEPGDLYMFHNRRVLHGRSEYDPTKSRRFLQGCYMDWDEIVALDEKLRNK